MDNLDDDWFDEPKGKIIRECNVIDCDDEATYRLASLTDLISEYYCDEHVHIEFLLREVFYTGEWKKERL
jgi:hypothetical protein